MIYFKHDIYILLTAIKSKFVCSLLSSKSIEVPIKLH